MPLTLLAYTVARSATGITTLWPGRSWIGCALLLPISTSALLSGSFWISTSRTACVLANAAALVLVVSVPAYSVALALVVASAAAVASTQAVREVLIQNDPDNSADVLVGNSSAQTIQLKPGQSVVIPVTNLATVYAKSVSGTPTINYLGRS